MVIGMTAHMYVKNQIIFSRIKIKFLTYNVVLMEVELWISTKSHFFKTLPYDNRC